MVVGNESITSLPNTEELSIFKGQTVDFCISLNINNNTVFRFITFRKTQHFPQVNYILNFDLHHKAKTKSCVDKLEKKTFRFHLFCNIVWDLK